MASKSTPVGQRMSGSETSSPRHSGSRKSPEPIDPPEEILLGQVDLSLELFPLQLGESKLKIPSLDELDSNSNISSLEQGGSSSNVLPLEQGGHNLRISPPERTSSLFAVSPNDVRDLEISLCQETNAADKSFPDRLTKQQTSSPITPAKESGKSSRTELSDASQNTMVEQRDYKVLETASDKDGDVEMASVSENVANDGWDGPEDPANPMNWPKWKRLSHVTMVAVIVFLVNLSTTISAPASGVIMKEFHQSNAIIGSFTVSIFLLGFTLGPLLMAPLSELYGRLIVYHLSIATFIAFVLGCGFSQSITAFLVLRFIAGCAASSPSTIGGGTVADVIPVQERGAAMAVTALGPILAPVIGPVAGGFITQKVGWRWTFWIVGIAAGTWLIAAVIFMRETYAPVLLERKASRIRKSGGRVDFIVKGGRGNLTPLAYLGRGLTRPLKLLILSPVVLLLSIYVAFVFGLMFLCFSTYSAVFIEQYHFSVGVSGLTYLGQGTGMVIGLGLFATLSDKILKARAAKHKGEMTPEERLPLMVYFTPIIPIGFFWYGWTAQEKVQWMAPICATSFIGMGNLFVMLPAQIYLVDAFGPQMAASALAANSLLRSLFGTFLPLAAPKLYASMGYGWGNTLFGFLALAFMPLPYLFYKHGAYLRNKFLVRF